MTQEHGWDKKRGEQEFETAKTFLRSMGLPEEQQKLTFEQVKKGEGRTSARDNPYTSRAIFSADELDR